MGRGDHTATGTAGRAGQPRRKYEVTVDAQARVPEIWLVEASSEQDAWDRLLEGQADELLAEEVFDERDRELVEACEVERARRNAVR